MPSRTYAKPRAGVCNRDRLAVGSYDLVIDGVLVGSLVREVSTDGGHRTRRAELLDDVSAERMPSLFSGIEHRLPSLVAAAEWLGDTVTLDNFG